MRTSLRALPPPVLVVGAALGLSLVAGCKDARIATGADDKFIHEPTELNATPPPPEKSLFPGKLESKWIYQLGIGESGKEEFVWLGSRTVEGTTATVFSGKRTNGANREELFRISPEGIEQVSAGGQEKVTLKPPMPLLKYPLSFEETLSWQGGVQMRDALVPSQARSRLRAVESVTVPAGTFTAYRVDTELDAQLPDGSVHFITTRWLAPGVGPVKIRYVVQAPGRPDHAYIKELLSYKL